MGMAVQLPEDSSHMKLRKRTGMRCLISMELKVRITPRSLAEMQSRSFRKRHRLAGTYLNLGYTTHCVEEVEIWGKASGQASHS
jgi:hypothetical protein